MAPITAVVVTRGRSDYLPRALVALAEQTQPPERVVLVDVGDGQDPAIAEMANRCGIPAEDLVFVHARGARNFGRAVAAGLAAVEISPNERLFLLHDDCYPAPDCLETLARAIEFAPSVVIAGPKQRCAQMPQSLGEVGVAVSRFGRRMTGAEDGELDQGQYDHREDVLGVGTAGMLVRADAWVDLGGIDPALGPFRDGLDLSRRARLAGHRVIVVPAAVVFHEQASFRGMRSRRSDDVRRSFGARRRAFIHTQLVHAPLILVPFIVVASLVSGLGRAVWRLATKDLDLIAVELAAPLAVLGQPHRILLGRRLASRSRRLKRGTLRPLQTTWADVRAMKRDRRLARAEEVRQAQAPSEVELADLAALAARRRIGKLAAWGVLLVAVVACLARLVGPGQVVGGALAPLTASVAGAWSRALGTWVSAGLGTPGPADPWAAVLACAHTISWGHGVLLLTLLAPVLSATGAWYAAGAGARSVSVRTWACVAYTASPVLWTALAQGRLGAATAHGLLPWILLTVARAVGADRRDLIRRAVDVDGSSDVPGTMTERSMVTRRPSLGDAAIAGLLLGVACAGAPILLPVCLILLLATQVVARFQWRLLITALLPLVCFARLIKAAITAGSWRMLLADPGVPLASNPTPLWRALLGWTDEPVVPYRLSILSPVLVALSCFIVGAALLALLRRGGRGAAVRLAWGVAVAGLATVWLAGRIPTAMSTSTMVTPWSGAAVSLVTAGLLMAAAAGADGAGGRFFRRGSAPRLQAAALVAVMLIGPIAGLATTIWQWSVSRSVLVERSSRPALPAVAGLAAAGDDATSTLVLSRKDGVTQWHLTRGSGPDLLDMAAVAASAELEGSLTHPSPVEPTPGTIDISSLVAGMVGGGAGGTADALSRAGVGFVFTPVGNKTLAAALDSTEGLSRTAEAAEVGIAWRVGDADSPRRSAWAQLVEPDGSWTALPVRGAVIPPGGTGRLVVLSESADSGWKATIAGVGLEAGRDDWRQSFDVPASGGSLEISRGRDPLVTGQITILVMSLLVAMPLSRRRASEEA
ncbi:MAG: glycosyltransferase family 2 protein [Micrococcales bacterium]|nr:glycosyltransferase family 2 protein [Micrococcales bacterium]